MGPRLCVSGSGARVSASSWPGRTRLPLAVCLLNRDGYTLSVRVIYWSDASALPLTGPDTNHHMK